MKGKFATIIMTIIIILIISVFSLFGFIFWEELKKLETSVKPEDVKTVCEECKGGKRGCVACKKQLANNIIETLRPIREKRAYYEEHPEEVDKILIEGTEKARKEAKETMKRVKKAMRLDYFEK